MKTDAFLTGDSLAKEITAILREKVLCGDYAIGEKMAENNIGSELKVSRTPVRQALKQLEQEGLIDYIPGKGCFASGFTKQDMKDIYSVRKSVEQMAVKRAIERITPEEIAMLEQQCQLMEFYTEKKNYKKVLELNNAFHETLYGATRSRFIVQTLKSYHDYVQAARSATVSTIENLPHIYEEHKKIMEAISQRDTALAVKRMGEHLDKSRKRIEAKWKIK